VVVAVGVVAGAVEAAVAGLEGGSCSGQG
jgi:hypothetical protein